MHSEKLIYLSTHRHQFQGFFKSKIKIQKVLLIESNGQKAPLHLNHGKAVYLLDYPGCLGARRSEGVHH